MKKLIYVLLLLLISCTDNTPIEPIEKYKGGIVVLKWNETTFYPDLQLKFKDSIFWIRVVKYDSDRFEYGDTIK